MFRIYLSSCFLCFLFISTGFGGSPDLPEQLQPALDLFNNGELIEAYKTLNEFDANQEASKEFLFLKAMTKWKMMWLSTYNAADKKEVLKLLDEVDELCLPNM